MIKLLAVVLFKRVLQHSMKQKYLQFMQFPKCASPSSDRLQSSSPPIIISLTHPLQDEGLSYIFPINLVLCQLWPPYILSCTHCIHCKTNAPPNKIEYIIKFHMELYHSQNITRVLIFQIVPPRGHKF